MFFFIRLNDRFNLNISIMGIEIERKFLVKGEFIHLAVKKISIKQAYFCIDPDRIIRLRITDGKGLLTFKSRPKENSFTRNEWEFAIPLNEAEDMLEICLPGMIDKTRYIVPFENHIFEVDVFHGKRDGLIVAELELTSETEDFEKPDWLGEEVTGNPGYYNSSLI
jgi:adenylate cyclase